MNESASPERSAHGVVALVLMALAGAGCGARDGGVPEALLEVERLAFVPSGYIDTGRVRFDTGPLGASEALLVDMYETTRARWLLYEASQPEPPDPVFVRLRGTWDATTSDWPATCMTQVEAVHFAETRGMRLLSAGEWLFCALGRDPRPYPWGSYGQASIANTLELGLERPAPVGTFEAGRTPQFVYDMLGNVAEWVADREPLPSEASLVADARISALGGSYRSYARPIFDPKPSSGERDLLAQTLASESRADDIGLRCCVSANDYLWTHASAWGDSASARSRLVALGRRWGRRALPVLESLATRPDAPASLDALAEGARQ